MLVEHYTSIYIVIHETYFTRIMDTSTLYHYSKMSCPSGKYLIKKVRIFTHLCYHAVLWLSDVYRMAYLLFNRLVTPHILHIRSTINPIPACHVMSMPASRLRMLCWIPVL